MGGIYTLKPRRVPSVALRFLTFAYYSVDVIKGYKKKTKQHLWMPVYVFLFFFLFLVPEVVN